MPLPRVVLLILALAGGGATALLVPAAQGSGADHAVVATDSGTSHSWSPATITIAVGDSVTWSYPSGTSAHNVEFTDGPSFEQPATPSPAGWTVTRTFATAGTYHYECSLHTSLMTGTVVVGDGAATTTTTTTGTTPTSSSPTTSTPTTTPAAAPDTTAPRAGHVRILRGRLRLTLTERARLQGTLTRGTHRVARLSRELARGAGSLRLPAHLKAGRYRLRFTLVDAAGNTSPARTVRFTVSRR